MLGYFIALFSCIALCVPFNKIFDKQIEKFIKYAKSSDSKIVFYSLTSLFAGMCMIIYPVFIVKDYQNGLYLDMILKILIGNVLVIYSSLYDELEKS